MVALIDAQTNKMSRPLRKHDHNVSFPTLWEHVVDSKEEDDYAEYTVLEHNQKNGYTMKSSHDPQGASLQVIF